ncbi:hypothetical protein DLJ53_11490 [Acuticoccus sediminis]|uniref:Uncharacterized protein n=1 Tax=Acuticoccus sediminis TaxID=2184697 RepID=A0A8B2NZK8_9HYPH|nr:hypothetical protein [Acuticoccus sediminis]RAI02000.1 hypothetical protein DLJ53_11490 [Acuticoccus sediminis]
MTTPWTPEEIAAFAARYGLTDLTPEMLDRMREIADKVAEASAAIPRMPRKDDEPAPVFRVPLG